MGQFFMDDIDALLKEEYGDHERLLRIKSDFETKKLVTIEDRKYVEGLVSRYLHPGKEVQEKIVKVPEKRIVPPPQATTQSPSYEVKYQKLKEEKPIPKIGRKKNIRLIVVSVAAVVAALLVISAVAVNRDNLIDITKPSESKSISVDQESYVRGDIVSISGKASSATVVKLAISNPSNQQIWSETVSTKQSGEFTTLTIAGGTGWEQAGKYTLSSMHEGITDQVTFDFNPSESQ
jgi:hypothetical protein